jgi:trehalose-6-phosphate synthase
VLALLWLIGIIKIQLKINSFFFDICHISSEILRILALYNALLQAIASTDPKLP